MLLQSLSLTLVASLAAANPINRRSAPPYSEGQAFTLVANVTDTSKAIFDPPINGWSLSGTRVGANLYTATLHAGAGAVFFVNGTGQDVSSASTSLASPPVDFGTGNYMPGGLQFGPAASNDREAYLSLNLGQFGTVGAGITPGLRGAYADLFIRFDAGTFVVCNETAPAYGRPQYPVRFEAAAVPDNCVAISLLAQCAPLPELHGVDEFNLRPLGAKCYDDVAAIDWSQY
ncbi:hypothetical protein JX266_005348 [Neoarthrinium moseri]|nr:hypothetical protein JX266_005348 [Neoarthrinium moseri]